MTSSDAIEEKHWDEAAHGAELLADGEADQAISTLLHVIKHNPDNEYAFFHLGNAYTAKSDFPRAMKSYLRAVELVPSYVGALIGLGRTLRRLGHDNKAAKVAHQILHVRPDDPDGLHMLGTAHFAIGNYQDAVKYLTRLLAVPAEPELSGEARQILEQLGARSMDRDDE